MEKTARLVSAFVGSAAHPTIVDNKLVLTLTNGTALTGLASVCSYLAESAGEQGVALAGNTPEIQAQVQEWLLSAATELQPLIDDKLVKVNDCLASRTYLVGAGLTLADLVVFGTVHPAVAAFPVAQHGHFCNLIRWCDLIQHTSDKTGLYAPLNFKKPKFQPPAPQPAAPTKVAAAAAVKPDQKAEGSKTPPAEAKTEAKQEKSKPAAPAKPSDPNQSKQATASEDDKATKQKGTSKDKPAPPAKDDDEARIDMLDLRVGKIVKVDKHPNADALYLEEIDVGEGKPRQVISGLVKFVPQDKMQDRLVVVVCNLKPAKMREVMSYGMVLCASNDTHDQVDPINVPAGAKVGDKVTVAGFDAAPLAEVNPKKKILERLFPDMKTDASGVPNYKGVPFATAAGPTSSTICNAWVK